MLWLYSVLWIYSSMVTPMGCLCSWGQLVGESHQRPRIGLVGRIYTFVEWDHGLHVGVLIV